MDEIASRLLPPADPLGEASSAGSGTKLYLRPLGQLVPSRCASSPSLGGHGSSTCPAIAATWTICCSPYVIYHQGVWCRPHSGGHQLSTSGRRAPSSATAVQLLHPPHLQGNPLYSTVFREYLNLLFAKGYSVEFFTEGALAAPAACCRQDRHAGHDPAGHDARAGQASHPGPCLPRLST